MNILLVRLGALGDIVHAIPAAAALRAAMPHARIDWLVDAKHRPMVDLVTVVDRVVPLEGRTIRAWVDVVRRARQARYDVAFDFQGLMKSAVLARASGAARVAGFSIWHLREKSARPFYSDTDDAAADEGGHVIQKNLHLLHVAGIETADVEFPIADVGSRALDEVRREIGAGPFALINPGAAWPNKRWPPSRFGEVAAFLRDVRGLSSIVLWGPGEQDLAHAVVVASNGAARSAPPTDVADLVSLCRQAALIVSGDTGPLHIAAAVGTPAVALFGPTNPRRNGPWAPADVTVSRFDGCGCHYERECREATWCLESISVAEVTAAIQQRLGRGLSIGDAMSDAVRRLARYRVRLGFVAAMAALWLAHPTASSLAVGAAIAALGEGLRIWAAGHLEKGREVTASGPYRLVRHPLYVGSALIALGFAVASATVSAAVLVLAYLVLTYGAAIRSEEAHLTAKFGAAYPEYKEGRSTGADRRFSVRRVVRNREYRAVGGLFLMLALLAWKVL